MAGDTLVLIVDGEGSGKTWAVTNCLTSAPVYSGSHTGIKIGKIRPLCAKSLLQLRLVPVFFLDAA